MEDEQIQGSEPLKADNCTNRRYESPPLLADKGYDADYVSEASQAMRAVAVIPSKLNRKIQHDYDKNLHKERSLIKHMFNKLKHFSRIPTRYDKRAISFLSFLYLAPNLI